MMDDQQQLQQSTQADTISEKANQQRNPVNMLADHHHTGQCLPLLAADRVTIIQADRPGSSPGTCWQSSFD